MTFSLFNLCALLVTPSLSAPALQFGDLQLTQEKEDTTAGLVWDAGAALASAIEEGDVSVAGLTVLELGSGTGLVGLVAARAKAKHVLLTDMTLDVLTTNLQSNIDKVQGAGYGQVEVASLLWGDSEDIAKVKAQLPVGCVDMLLAADVVYAGFDLVALLTTLIQLSDLPSCSEAMARPSILLAYQERSRAMTMTLEKSLQANRFTWQRKLLLRRQTAHSQQQQMPAVLYLYRMQAPDSVSCRPAASSPLVSGPGSKRYSSRQGAGLGGPLQVCAS
eukprot:g63773.t1